MTQYYIPSNFSGENSWRGIPYRNIAEAIVGLLMMWWITGQIPLTGILVSVFRIIICLLFFGLGIFGIKDESVTQFIHSYVTFLKKRRKLHFRPAGFRTHSEIKEAEKNAEKGNLRSKAKFRTFKHTRTESDGAEPGGAEPGGAEPEGSESDGTRTD